MKNIFYFSAVVCVLLLVFVFSVDALHSQAADNAETIMNGKWKKASNANQKAGEARSLMNTLEGKYSENLKDIQKGKRVVLSTVFTGASAMAVTYISGGSTVTVMVPYAIKTAVESLNLAGSINVNSELESAFETAIGELSSRVSYTDQAITDYIHAWDNYRVAVINHNAQYHGSNSSPSDLAHEIEPCEPPDLDKTLPSFTCPGGGCNITYSYPSTARTVHYARCGTSDDPYNTSLQGCNKVYYTCNTSEKSRHQPVDCGLNKWLETTHGWAETACSADYRKCMPGRIQREHSTLITGVNVTSTCGGSRPSPPSENPIVSPPPPPTPPPSPTYHACGEHETSVSGDHSLQASCSSSNSNGNCTVTNFYACDGHTHVYPEPPPTVSCGRRACTETVSSTNEHRRGPCTACDKIYWSCGTYGSYHENECRLRTCRYGGCGNQWRRCQSDTPYCRNNPDRRCWAR